MKIRIPRADLYANVSFIIFMVTTFFGTSIPFQKKAEEAGDVASSNIISMLLYPTLFLLSLVAFLPNTKKIINYLKQEKILSFFLLWALFTITWSAYPFVSFKRWFQIFNYLFIPLVYFSYVDSIKQVISTIKPILFVYLSISIIVVFVVPGALDPLFHTWRGLAPHKNVLGQISLMCIILLSITLYQEDTLKQKIITSIYLCIAVVLLIGANSSTNILAFLLFLSSSAIFYLQTSIFKQLGIGRFIALASIFSFLGIFYLLYTQAPEIVESLNLTGKDVTTFSDRTYLWEYMMFEISNHPIFGCGFRGFWVVDSLGIERIWSRFLFLPIQAHNGYLDIMNEMGIIGIILLVLLLVRYFLRVNKVGGQNFWVWFILIPLFINATETTLFREGHITFIFFIMSYLLPFIFTDSESNSDSFLYNPDNPNVFLQDLETKNHRQVH